MGRLGSWWSGYVGMLRKFALAACFLVPVLCHAQSLKLDYGVNRVDINADGVEDMIVRTRWDVNSAHSADRYFVAVALKGGPGGMPIAYYDVGFEQDNSTAFFTSEGADCVLSGYVFRLNKKRMLEIDY